MSAGKYSQTGTESPLGLRQFESSLNLSILDARFWVESSPFLDKQVYHASPGVVHALPSIFHKGTAMTIDQISLPKGVGPHASKLLDAITGASTHEELNRAGGKAEGFVLGLESTKAIKSQIAESLYVAYDDAASNRASELKG